MDVYIIHNTVYIDDACPFMVCQVLWTDNLPSTIISKSV
jgi:hypothetical protein